MLTFKFLLAFAVGLFIGMKWSFKIFKNNAFSDGCILANDGKYKVVKLDNLESLKKLERVNLV